MSEAADAIKHVFTGADGWLGILINNKHYRLFRIGFRIGIPPKFVFRLQKNIVLSLVFVLIFAKFSFDKKSSKNQKKHLFTQKKMTCTTGKNFGKSSR